MAFHFEWDEGFNKRCIVTFFKYSQNTKNMVKRGNLFNGIKSFDFRFVSIMLKFFIKAASECA